MCIRDRSVMSSITQIPLKYLFNKINGKVIDVGIDTNEQVILKECQYRVTENSENKIMSGISRTEIIMDTAVIRGRVW